MHLGIQVLEWREQELRYTPMPCVAAPFAPRAAYPANSAPVPATCTPQPERCDAVYM